MQNRDSLFDWAIPCGTWFGVRVRLSLVFVLVAAILSFQAFRRDDVRVGLVFAACLLTAVFLHELAHLFALRLTGGAASDLVLWPLGGIVRLSAGSSPAAPIATAAAGPMTSLAICCICLPGLARSGEGWRILDPFEFPVADLDARFAHSLLSLLFFANWLLVVANALPALPLDGGRMLESVMVSRLGHGLGGQMLSRIGMTIGGVAIVSALLIESPWLCAIGAGLVAFNLRDSLRFQHSEGFDESFMGYDFSQGYTSLEKSVPVETEARRQGLLERWRARRRLLKEQRQRARAEEAERELDILLAKVHTYGIDSLTDGERRTLKRASARYRGRSKS